MILTVGGVDQDKLGYVLQKTRYDPAQVARTPEEARTRPVFAGLEDWPELGETALLEANPGVILIHDEVGHGMVPVEPTQRTRREVVGRLCCRLAARAERVEHIFCGLLMVLKGEGLWS